LHGVVPFFQWDQNKSSGELKTAEPTKAAADIRYILCPPQNSFQILGKKIPRLTVVVAGMYSPVFKQVIDTVLKITAVVN
jgi:hypothetical protein